MKGIVKFFLTVLVVLVFALNYKFLSFSGGFKIASFPKSDSSVTETVKTLMDTEAIYYYKHPFSDSQILVIETTGGMQVYQATELEINALKVSSYLLGSKFSPNKVSVIPIWIFLIAIAVIIFMPTSFKRKKSKSKK